MGVQGVHENHPSVWDYAAAAVAHGQVLIGALAGVGYFAKVLLDSKEDSRLDKRKMLGGVLLASFTGGFAYLMFKGAGLHMEIAAPAAFLIGSSGEKGYKLLLQRAKDKGII